MAVKSRRVENDIDFEVLSETMVTRETRDSKDEHNAKGVASHADLKFAVTISGSETLFKAHDTNPEKVSCEHDGAHVATNNEPVKISM